MRPTSDIYVEGHRAVAHAFFGWCVREGLLERSPMLNVRRVKADRPRPLFPTDDEVRRLLAAAAPTYEGVRTRTMVALMADTGVRVGELVRIELARVDLGRSEITVMGKTRRAETVPVSAPMHGVLVEYLALVRPPGPLLFTARSGAPLSENAIEQVLVHLCRRAGTPHFSPHDFRHYFATSFLRNGGDAFSLQRILRHRSRGATEWYEHLAGDDVARRHAAASPLARIWGE